MWRKNVKLCFFQLHLIRAIRPYLDQQATEALEHTFISSHLDYCKSLLFGTSNLDLNKTHKIVQHVLLLVYLTGKTLILQMFCYSALASRFGLHYIQNWQLLFTCVFMTMHPYTWNSGFHYVYLSKLYVPQSRNYYNNCCPDIRKKWERRVLTILVLLMELTPCCNQINQ